MKQAPWEKLLQGFEKMYYTELVALLVSFFLLYIIIKYFVKAKFSYLFLIYSISCILLLGGMTIYKNFLTITARLDMIVIESANTFFAISELCIFTTFFFQIIDSKTFKKLLVLLCGCFLVAIILFFRKVLDDTTNRDEILKASIVVNILEFSIFLLAVLSYFIELFKKPPTQDITQSPAFWIASGFFVYILVSLPMLLFTEYIWIENRKLYFLLFSLHFIAMALLLLTIAKAFLCRKPITT